MNQEWEILADKVYKTKQARKYYEALEKAQMEKLKKLSNGVPTIGEFFTLAMIERLGSIDYSLIPVLKEMDLELYRKKPVTSWSLVENPKLPEGL